MYILGVSAGMHDSSAALIRSGEVIAFAEEERFNREKHTGAIPLNAIRFCLEYARIRPEEVEAIGFFWRPFKGLLKRLYYQIVYSKNIIRDINLRQAGYLFDFLRVPFVLAREFGFRCRFSYLDHYQCHIESVFATSPFEESIVLISDGNGEVRTLSGGIYNGRDYKEVISFNFPHSIGLVYMSITDYLGFRANIGEGKTMGLAPYGRDRFVEKMDKIVRIDDNGQLKVDLDYFDYHYGKKNYVTELFEKTFGKRRLKGEEIEDHHKDVAYAVQYVTEKIISSVLRRLTESSEIKNLVLGGGLFLNSVMNYRILKNLAGYKVFIPPWVNDGGASIGAALLISKEIDANYTRNSCLTPYLGPEFDERTIEEELNRYGIKYIKSDNIFLDVAKRIAEGKIAGWFQGRMEAGPRALGNRSIIADPRRRDMKDILNKRVKHRESFRPYAPAVLFERQKEFFDMDFESPYMLFACNVKENMRDLIPAVVHVDGTSRIQSVTENTNYRFYRLIK